MKIIRVNPCSSEAQKILLVLILALFAARNLPWHLDDFDQAKQAYTSFEMVKQGHWWFQHTPAQNVATKPPLAGWISAGLYYLTHGWEAAWRLPSFASALAILALLFWMGERAWPGSGGVIAGGMFAFNLMTPRLASLVRTDMLLTLFIASAGFLIHEKVRTASAWAPRERWLLFLLVLGSMMTKGPIGCAFLLPGLIAFVLLCKCQRLPANVWSGWWSWFLPLLLFAAWAAVGIARDREFYEQVVMKEFLGRFTVGEQAIHKNQPLYFYLTHLLRDFAPWSLLLIALPFFKNVRSALMSNRAALWLICWSLAGLLVMSLVPSKRPDRIFPVVPPLSLLLVYGLREVPWRSRAVPGLVTLAVCISTGYAAFNVVSSYRGNEQALTCFGARVRDYSTREKLRCEVVSSKDEGMLLYLRQPVFVKMRDAAQDWREGKIDALILNETNYSKDADALQPWFLADASGIGRDKNSQYFFIVRSVPRPGPQACTRGENGFSSRKADHFSRAPLMKIHSLTKLAICALSFFPAPGKSADPAALTPDLQSQGPAVSPMLHGLMTGSVSVVLSAKTPEDTNTIHVLQIEER